MIYNLFFYNFEKDEGSRRIEVNFNPSIPDVKAYSLDSRDVVHLTKIPPDGISYKRLNIKEI